MDMLPGYYFELFNLMTMLVIGPFDTYELCEIARMVEIVKDTIQNGEEAVTQTIECWEWILTEDV